MHSSTGKWIAGVGQGNVGHPGFPARCKNLPEKEITPAGRVRQLPDSRPQYYHARRCATVLRFHPVNLGKDTAAEFQRVKKVLEFPDFPTARPSHRQAADPIPAFTDRHLKERLKRSRNITFFGGPNLSRTMTASD